MVAEEAQPSGAGGRPVWWLPDSVDAAAALGPRLGEGDLLVTIGAGDIFKLAEALADSDGERSWRRPEGVEANYPARALDHHPGRRPGRTLPVPSRRGRSPESPRLGRIEGLSVAVVGSGPTCWSPIRASAAWC